MKIFFGWLDSIGNRTFGALVWILSFCSVALTLELVFFLQAQS